ncbi:MAG: efflux RND transporter periplasmic adaptor subunit [Roseivirga sp.]
MDRRTKIWIGLLLLISLGLAAWWLNLGAPKHRAAALKTETPVKMDIINKKVISGSLVPCKEAALKSQMAGVVDKLYVAIGDQIKAGAPVARIKALPKSRDVEGAKKALKIAQIALEEAQAKYKRSKRLFEKKMLSSEQYAQYVKVWKTARAEAAYAQKHLDLVRQGHTAGGKESTNIVRATISGLVSELPCKEGSAVMEQSTFNEGSTVATISDMSIVLFQGNVGEMEVAYLYPGMQFDAALNAVQGKKFPVTLTRVAPKPVTSKEDKWASTQGKSVKFAIEGEVQLKKEDRAIIRAGYTATADVVLEKAVDVLAIREQWLHTEASPGEEALENDTAFVWVYENKQKVKKPVQLGVSNGIYVEVKAGLTENDQVITVDDSY